MFVSSPCACAETCVLLQFPRALQGMLPVHHAKRQWALRIRRGVWGERECSDVHGSTVSCESLWGQTTAGDWWLHYPLKTT